MLTEQVIADGSLRARGDAFTFGLRMPWYRALPLSSLEGLDVRIDDDAIASDELRISLGGTSMRWPSCRRCTTMWYVADAAEVRAPKTGGLAPGPHVLECRSRRASRTSSSRGSRLRDARALREKAGRMTLPKLGVTLYSFTPDFHAGRYTFEDLVVEAAERGLGPGLEVIGFQSFRGFPHMSPEVETRFLASSTSTGGSSRALTATSTSPSGPTGYSTRTSSSPTWTRSSRRRRDSASRCSACRTRRRRRDGTAGALRRAARRQVGMEIHAPETVRSPGCSRCASCTRDSTLRTSASSPTSARRRSGSRRACSRPSARRASPRTSAGDRHALGRTRRSRLRGARGDRELHRARPLDGRRRPRRQPRGLRRRHPRPSGRRGVG